MTRLRTERSNPEFSPAHTTTMTLHSSHLQRRQDVTVYHHLTESHAQQVPIILLLHGVYGSNWVWMQLGGAHLVYEQLKAQGLQDFILVMPSDGGLWDGSGYLPLIEHGNYERWIMDDVLHAVSTHIQGASMHSNLYISGLSMGGYGALRLAAKYPQRFAGISAHSSVTSLTDLQSFIARPISDYQCQFTHEADLYYWLAKNKAQLAALRFDCGRQDPLYASNVALADWLSEQQIPHQFDRFAGGHQWEYWHQHLADSLWFFHQLENQFTRIEHQSFK